ncbi:DsbA family oxidoreductase [Chryseosolibacter indicus]|uniref:DsbA family oxidoreductase n=1 Tax=Chryseosolibacter indicus TaxID=2782351 RepID=A0ABS5VM45_9BACT|nr:DsbA family oxidoreductase [Chryseosolibacter indicus]MBT1702519.1 DsbA family oxidoreductase [Chryseosolibacter indicus]
MSKPIIKVAVVSDVVCPWCYIGKRRLENAVSSLSDKYDFEVAYYPFELNPDLPLEGTDQKEYLSAKFGGEHEYEQKTNHVSQIAATEGLEFNYNKQLVSPNTRNAHRLILLANEEGKQIALVEALFKAYFTDGVNLSKKENLVDIASSTGMDREKVKDFLDSDTGLTEVAAAETELQRIGISGVPFYIINDKYGVSGAQPSHAFIEAFENIGKEMVLAGETCDVEAKNC